jgi:small subunit ribosomal protein S2
MTNFSEVAKNFKKLNDLTEKLKDPEKRAGYTKKEISLWEKERIKLESFYGGIKDMAKLPDAIFIIDTHTEYLAVHEAKSMGVTIVGITDTNSDPTIIDYPIPANDDAVGSIKLLTGAVVDTWIEGRKIHATRAEKESKESSEARSGSAGQKARSEEKKEISKESKDTTDKKEEKPKKEKAVKTSKAKVKETKKTPEKLSAE